MLMSYDVFLALFIAVVAVIMLGVRTNAAVVFFSLCAGSVLASQLGSEASLISSTVISDGELNHGIIYSVLIIAPSLLSAFFLRKSVSSSKLLANVLPAAAFVMLLILLVTPQLPADVREVIVNDNITWDYLQQFQPIILMVGMLSSIFMLWVNQKTDKKSKKKH